MGTKNPLDGVAATALGAARARAAESNRPDALFQDQYAQAFVDVAPGVLPGPATGEPTGFVAMAFAFHAAVRTRFFDDFLLQSSEGGCRQVVLLGAGLDTRAHRLAWPQAVRLFEVDQPQVLAFKEHVLAKQNATPRCARTLVPTDLRQDWAGALLAAGLNPVAPTAWLAEGLLIYLSAVEATSLLSDVTRLAAQGSHLALEHGVVDPALAAQINALPAMADYTSMWKGGLGDRTHAWLTQHTWRVQTTDRIAVAGAYGRAAPAGCSGGHFLIATRHSPKPPLQPEGHLHSSARRLLTFLRHTSRDQAAAGEDARVWQGAGCDA